jgi:hypothetical protein
MLRIAYNPDPRLLVACHVLPHALANPPGSPFESLEKKLAAVGRRVQEIADAVLNALEHMPPTDLELVDLTRQFVADEPKPA